MQPHCLVEARLPACPSRFGPAERQVRPRRDRSASGILGRQVHHDLAADAPDRGVMAVGNGMDRVTEVPQQMPAVADLDGIGRALAHAVGVGPGTIPGDDLDARVLPQPGRQGLGLAVRQEVEHAVPLEVDEDGPITMATTPGPVIDRQHPHGWPRLRDGAGAPRHPQQRIGADGHGQPHGEAGADLATGGEAEMALQVAQPLGPPGRGRRGVGAPFGEGDPRTGRLQAAEAPGLDPQPHRMPLPGQVTEHAVIPAVDPPGRHGAGRAGRPGLAWRDDDGEMVGRGQDLLDQQPCRNERQETLGQEANFGGGETLSICSLRPGTTTRSTGSAGDPVSTRHPHRAPIRSNSALM